MLTLFENVTSSLTEVELNSLVPLLIEMIGTRKHKYEAVTNKHLCIWLKKEGFETSEVRIRMMVNFIRNSNKLPCLIGSAKGYYITNNPAEVDNQITSLQGRINAMRNVVESLKAQKINLIRR